MVRCEMCLLYSICDDKEHCSLSDFAKKRIDENIAKIESYDKDQKLIIDGLLCLREVYVRNSESLKKDEKVDALINLHKVDDLLARLYYNINKAKKEAPNESTHQNHVS